LSDEIHLDLLLLLAAAANNKKDESFLTVNKRRELLSHIVGIRLARLGLLPIIIRFKKSNASPLGSRLLWENLSRKPKLLQTEGNFLSS